MKMAGEQWQYGKRRISAMTNEEFNKLTPIKLYEIETSELRAMIPLMQESMRDMNKLTPIIVTEMIQMFKDFVTGLFQGLQSETDKNLHPLFNWMLSVMGFPERNIGSSLDFDNTPDKFNPPTEIIQFPKDIPKKDKPLKSIQQIDEEEEKLKKHITKITIDPIMQQYTKFLAEISAHNQRLKQFAKHNPKQVPKIKVAKGKTLQKFKNWQRINRKWMLLNKLV